MLWLTLIGVTMMTTIVSCKVQSVHETQQGDAQDSISQDSTSWETASFFPYYIVEMSESVNSLGHKCYWLIYDDPDANFFNEVVSMDEETFHIVLEIWNESANANRIKANKHNHRLLELLDEHEPYILNSNGSAVLILSDKD